MEKNTTWPFDKTHPYIFDNMYNIDGFETWKKRRQPDRFNEYRSWKKSRTFNEWNVSCVKWDDIEINNINVIFLIIVSLSDWF